MGDLPESSSCLSPVRNSFSGIIPHPPSSTSSSEASLIYGSALFAPSSSLLRGSNSDSLPWKQSIALQELKLSSADEHPIAVNEENSMMSTANDMGFEDINADFIRENIHRSQLKNSGMHWTENSDFSSGLVLLQANVIHLCITTGINPRNLWPPQALLLNLRLLNEFCLNKTLHFKSAPHTASNTIREEDSSGGAEPQVDASPSNNFELLGKSLKHYCDAIQSKSSEGNQKGNSFILERMRKLSRSRVEANYYCHDDSKFIHQQNNSMVGQSEVVLNLSSDEIEEGYDSDENGFMYISSESVSNL